MMVPLIQAAHDYRCIHYYRLYKRLFHNPSFPILFSNGKPCSSVEEGMPGDRSVSQESSQTVRRGGRFSLLCYLMLVASMVFSVPPSL